MRKVDNRFISRRMRDACRAHVESCGEIREPLGAVALDGAVVLPYRCAEEYYSVGMVHADGSAVIESSLHEFVGADEYPIESVDEIVYDDRDVIYGGLIISQWGHALTDNLKRLWFLESPQGRTLLEKGVKVVYVKDPHFHLDCAAAKILELAGADLSSWEEVTVPTRFRRVWNPDLSLVEHKHGRRWAPQLAALYDRILDKIPVRPCPYTHIYFSRTKLTNQAKEREYGEKAIEKLFRKKGFHIAYPETLTLEEQVNMLRNCKCFAATEGSVAHNAVWCPAAAHVIILQKARYFNSWQTAINNMRGYDVTYIEAHRSTNIDDNPCGGPFYMCVNHYLERFFGHRIPHLPRFLRPSWWRYKRIHEEDYAGLGFATPRISALKGVGDELEDDGDMKGM